MSNDQPPSQADDEVAPWTASTSGTVPDEPVLDPAEPGDPAATAPLTAPEAAGVDDSPDAPTDHGLPPANVGQTAAAPAAPVSQPGPPPADQGLPAASPGDAATETPAEGRNPLRDWDATEVAEKGRSAVRSAADALPERSKEAVRSATESIPELDPVEVASFAAVGSVLGGLLFGSGSRLRGGLIGALWGAATVVLRRR